MSRTRHLGTGLAVVVAAALLLLTANSLSYAAGGPSVLLGSSNKASKTTVIASSKGPALSLKAKANVPPLLVSSKHIVPKLNASLLGGQTSQQLEPTSATYLLGAKGDSLPSYYQNAMNLAAGTYYVNLRAVRSGTGESNCYVFPAAQVITDHVFDNLVGGEGHFLVVGSGVLEMPANDVLAVGCDGDVGTLGAPLQLTIRPLTAWTKGPFVQAQMRPAQHLRGPLLSALRSSPR